MLCGFIAGKATLLSYQGEGPILWLGSVVHVGIQAPYPGWTPHLTVASFR